MGAEVDELPRWDAEEQPLVEGLPKQMHAKLCDPFLSEAMKRGVYQIKVEEDMSKLTPDAVEDGEAKDAGAEDPKKAKKDDAGDDMTPMVKDMIDMLVKVVKIVWGSKAGEAKKMLESLTNAKAKKDEKLTQQQEIEAEGKKLNEIAQVIECNPLSNVRLNLEQANNLRAIMAYTLKRMTALQEAVSKQARKDNLWNTMLDNKDKQLMFILKREDMQNRLHKVKIDDLEGQLESFGVTHEKALGGGGDSGGWGRDSALSMFQREQKELMAELNGDKLKGGGALEKALVLQKIENAKQKYQIELLQKKVHELKKGNFEPGDYDVGGALGGGGGENMDRIVKAVRKTQRELRRYCSLMRVKLKDIKMLAIQHRKEATHDLRKSQVKIETMLCSLQLKTDRLATFDISSDEEDDNEPDRAAPPEVALELLRTDHAIRPLLKLLNIRPRQRPTEGVPFSEKGMMRMSRCQQQDIGEALAILRAKVREAFLDSSDEGAINTWTLKGVEGLHDPGWDVSEIKAMVMEALAEPKLRQQVERCFDIFEYSCHHPGSIPRKGVRATPRPEADNLERINTGRQEEHILMRYNIIARRDSVQKPGTERRRRKGRRGRDDSSTPSQSPRGKPRSALSPGMGDTLGSSELRRSPLGSRHLDDSDEWTDDDYEESEELPKTFSDGATQTERVETPKMRPVDVSANPFPNQIPSVFLRGAGGVRVIGEKQKAGEEGTVAAAADIGTAKPSAVMVVQQTLKRFTASDTIEESALEPAASPPSRGGVDMASPAGGGESGDLSNSEGGPEAKPMLAQHMPDGVHMMLPGGTVVSMEGVAVLVPDGLALPIPQMNGSADGSPGSADFVAMPGAVHASLPSTAAGTRPGTGGEGDPFAMSGSMGPGKGGDLGAAASGPGGSTAKDANKPGGKKGKGKRGSNVKGKAAPEAEDTALNFAGATLGKPPAAPKYTPRRISHVGGMELPVAEPVDAPDAPPTPDALNQTLPTAPSEASSTRRSTAESEASASMRVPVDRRRASLFDGPPAMPGLEDAAKRQSSERRSTQRTRIVAQEEWDMETDCPTCGRCAPKCDPMHEEYAPTRARANWNKIGCGMMQPSFSDGFKEILEEHRQIENAKWGALRKLLYEKSGGDMKKFNSLIAKANPRLTKRQIFAKRVNDKWTRKRAQVEQDAVARYLATVKTDAPTHTDDSQSASPTNNNAAGTGSNAAGTTKGGGFTGGRVAMFAGLAAGAMAQGKRDIASILSHGRRGSSKKAPVIDMDLLGKDKVAELQQTIREALQDAQKEAAKRAVQAAQEAAAASTDHRNSTDTAAPASAAASRHGSKGGVEMGVVGFRADDAEVEAPHRRDSAAASGVLAFPVPTLELAGFDGLPNIDVNKAAAEITPPHADRPDISAARQAIARRISTFATPDTAVSEAPHLTDETFASVSTQPSMPPLSLAALDANPRASTTADPLAMSSIHPHGGMSGSVTPIAGGGPAGGMSTQLMAALQGGGSVKKRASNYNTRSRAAEMDALRDKMTQETARKVQETVSVERLKAREDLLAYKKQVDKAWKEVQDYQRESESQHTKDIQARDSEIRKARDVAAALEGTLETQLSQLEVERDTVGRLMAELDRLRKKVDDDRAAHEAHREKERARRAAAQEAKRDAKKNRMLALQAEAEKQQVKAEAAVVMQVTDGKEVMPPPPLPDDASPPASPREQPESPVLAPSELENHLRMQKDILERQLADTQRAMDTLKNSNMQLTVRVDELEEELAKLKAAHYNELVATKDALEQARVEIEELQNQPRLGRSPSALSVKNLGDGLMDGLPEKHKHLSSPEQGGLSRTQSMTPRTASFRRSSSRGPPKSGPRTFELPAVPNVSSPTLVPVGGGFDEATGESVLRSVLSSPQLAPLRTTGGFRTGSPPGGGSPLGGPLSGTSGSADTFMMIPEIRSGSPDSVIGPSTPLPPMSRVQKGKVKSAVAVMGLSAKVTSSTGKAAAAEREASTKRINKLKKLVSVSQHVKATPLQKTSATKQQEQRDRAGSLTSTAKARGGGKYDSALTGAANGRDEKTRVIQQTGANIAGWFGPSPSNVAALSDGIHGGQLSPRGKKKEAAPPQSPVGKIGSPFPTFGTEQVERTPGELKGALLAHKGASPHAQLLNPNNAAPRMSPLSTQDLNSLTGSDRLRVLQQRIAHQNRFRNALQDGRPGHSGGGGGGVTPPAMGSPLSSPGGPQLMVDEGDGPVSPVNLGPVPARRFKDGGASAERSMSPPRSKNAKSRRLSMAPLAQRLAGVSNVSRAFQSAGKESATGGKKPAAASANANPTAADAPPDAPGFRRKPQPKTPIMTISALGT